MELMGGELGWIRRRWWLRRRRRSNCFAFLLNHLFAAIPIVMIIVLMKLSLTELQMRWMLTRRGLSGLMGTHLEWLRTDIGRSNHFEF